MASRERQVAIEAARAAGRLLHAELRAAHRIAYKGTSTNLVTEMDERAEELVVGRLAEAFPDDTILAEERGAVRGRSGRRWIVDPLDGTVNFVFGIPQWAVSVACEGVAGVVFDPCHDELFVAVDGQATLNGAPLRASQRDDLAAALVATGFGYESDVRRRQAEVVARVLPLVRDIRRAGSAALDMAWTAAGRLDAFYERGVKPWDIAAGELLCTAAGLEVRRLQAGDGLPAGVVAAPAPLIEPLLALVA
jgi:myo-inositol-1(or 4)-monophosphatase